MGKLATLVETLENHLLLAVRNAYAGIFHIKMYLAHAGRTTIPQLDAAFFRKLVGIVQEVGEYLCQSHGIYIHLHIFGREILEELQRRPDKQAMRLIDVIEQLAQETAKIKGLLLDLRKDENKPYVTTLGLDAYLAELEKENNAYDRLSQQRVQNRTTSKKESGANLRKRIDVYYDDLTLLAQSYGVAKPSEKATAFIAALNQLIAETIAAYNQRMAASKKPAPAPEPTPGGDSESPDEI